MNILLVVAHPRPDSLTHAVAKTFADAAAKAGHQIEWADLAAEGFNPALFPPDEPDWDDTSKTYSPEVQAEMARISRNQATVMVFPVWWWSVPALLKGWIDRVWNHGWAYGFLPDGTRAKYPHARVLMLAVAGGDAASFAKRGYDEAMRVQLEVGILDYCGVTEPKLQMLYDSFEAEGRAAILAEAKRLGEHW
jgi:NAD(P)H dehydrogenase (quinone)